MGSLVTVHPGNIVTVDEATFAILSNPLRVALFALNECFEYYLAVNVLIVVQMFTPFGKSFNR
jgi:hypothetical protein